MSEITNRELNDPHFVTWKDGERHPEKCDRCFYLSMGGSSDNRHPQCEKCMSEPITCKDCGDVKPFRVMFSINRETGMLCQKCHQKRNFDDKIEIKPFEALEVAIEQCVNGLIESRDWWRRLAIIWMIVSFGLAFTIIFKVGL